jgi:hypothetical protein
MTDPEISAPSRRRVTRVHRRQQARRAGAFVGAAFVVAGAIGAALVVTNVITLPGSTDARVTAPSHHRPTPTTTTTRVPVTAHQRHLTPSDPLRLWIAGDSLAGSIGPSLGEMTAQTGVVQPQYDSRVSSGLMNPNFFDWPTHVTEQLAFLKPEAVVFIVGTNDANVWSSNLADEYRLRTEAMMRALVGPNHRQVLWVGAPVAKAKSLESGVLNVNLIQRAAAARIRGVTYVDAHAIFADDNGAYQQSFTDELGRRQVMRAGDGVHFSVAGADYISRALFRLLDRSWNLTKQTVPGAAKPVLETKGSTQVPGTHRSVGAQVGASTGNTGSGSNGSTTTTTTVGSATTSTSSTTSTTSATTSTTSTTAPPPGP